MIYCGCCGRPVESVEAEWCRECEAHLLPELTYDIVGARRRLPYERTYFAQHKRRCPFSFSRR